jgi:hypothetical protein
MTMEDIPKSANGRCNSDLPHYTAAPLQALGMRRRVLRSTKRT